MTLEFEAQPTTSVVSSILASFFRSGNPISDESISLLVDGNAGTRLIAATTSADPFDHVVLGSTDDFAIANVRYAIGGTVSEPTLLVLLAIAFTTHALARHRRA